MHCESGHINGAKQQPFIFMHNLKDYLAPVEVLCLLGLNEDVRVQFGAAVWLRNILICFALRINHRPILVLVQVG